MATGNLLYKYGWLDGVDANDIVGELYRLRDEDWTPLGAPLYFPDGTPLEGMESKTKYYWRQFVYKP